MNRYIHAYLQLGKQTNALGNAFKVGGNYSIPTILLFTSKFQLRRLTVPL